MKRRISPGAAGSWINGPGRLLSGIVSPGLETALARGGEMDRALTEGLIAGSQVKPIRLTEVEECLATVGSEKQRATA